MVHDPASQEITRLGGELPALCDRYSAAEPWQPNWLGFSHGRAALAWLVRQQRARGALVCAYTCPSVPAFLRRREISIGFFDIGASVGDIAYIAPNLPAPRLVLVPALFGSRPWLDAAALATVLGDSAVVVIDAAQTAFGHLDFAPPRQGAVLSCPRKATSLPDGAVLALGDGWSYNPAADLPVATYPLALKQVARALWATGIVELEADALRWHRLSEASWPDEPHRISEESRILLARLDRTWHRDTRLANRAALLAALRPDLPAWAAAGPAPFSQPIFVANREKVLDHLAAARIFATALWPEAEHDPHRHPAGAWCVRHLVSLPVDQRHDASDMQRIAVAVNAVAHPAGYPPAELRAMVVPVSALGR